MWRAVQGWVDGTPGVEDPVTRARVRVQHLVVFLLHLVGIPYVGLFVWLDLAWASAVLICVIVAATLGLFLATRPGRPRLGGLIVSTGFFLTISSALVARGGMTSNSAAWLLLAPVLAVMMVGPRHGMLIGVAAALEFVGLWALETAGVPMLPGLAPAVAYGMIPVDYAIIALTISGILWAQSGIWDAVIDRLDTTNATLQAEVAERHAAEEQALAAAKARSTFLATMSHEIRTPLNGVLGLTEVLLDSELDADQSQLVTTVRSSGRLLRALLDDVLDFSKIDSGQLDLEEVPVDLRAVGDEVLQLWQATAAERGVALQVEVEDGVPGWVASDPTRLRQILGNLVSNALKFTERGSVTLRFGVEADALRIEVEDTGQGIAADAMEHIFEPFRQADATTTRKHGGTGLGLAICRRLAAAMSGTLDVRSTLGEGTVFTLTLPLRPTEPLADHRPGPDHAGALAGRRVLVAEDNPVNRMVVSRLLERLGVEVRLAEDGEACVRAWHDGAADLVLMDCQMPVCDGYEATGRLRAEGVTVPIVALTANTMPGDRARCIEAGMDDHLGKPIRPDELERTLARWMPAEGRSRSA